MISDLFCDGLGACIVTCPQNAIEIEEREAEPYNERNVMKNVIKEGPNVIKAHLNHLNDHNQLEYLNQAINFLKDKKIEVPDYKSEKTFTCACPGSMEKELTNNQTQKDRLVNITGELRNWPLQLQFLNPNAPYLKNSHL
jgi:ferredoxin